MTICYRHWPITAMVQIIEGKKKPMEIFTNDQFLNQFPNPSQILKLHQAIILTRFTVSMD